eukprot:7891645-Pyramimonas_sp.AAC.1
MISRCQRALPELSRFYCFENFGFTDYMGFHEYTREMNATMINDMIHNECTDCLGRIDEARRARLQAICRSWSVKRRELA